MKRWMIFVMISLFLIGFTAAISITSSAIDNSTDKDKGYEIKVQNKGDDKEIEVQSKFDNITKEKNKIRPEIKIENCPGNCTCTGSVIKCKLADGTREMTIIAGKSGNIIIQVKGINASTNVTLYKSEDGKVYGIFKNKTKIIKILPDQIREKIRERLTRQTEEEEIELNEEGEYEYNANKKARLFSIFPVRIKVRAEIDPETGKIIKLKKSWWEFLTKDESEEILGATCGTVSPDLANECCKNKGYEIWNKENQDCEFFSE